MAQATAARLGVPNARFDEGDATCAPWADFDGVYFFNPFAENLFPDCALRSARMGTAVVTYHGMGGRMPGSYELAHSEPGRTDFLRLWIKRDTTDDGSFFLEMEDRIVRVPARWRAMECGE